MAGEPVSPPAWRTLTDEQRRRWVEVLDHVADALPPGAGSVVVDGDDMPAYAAAVTEANLPAGGVVVDIGCGTGRALPALRAAVGPAGVVVGLDLTPQMLTAARAQAQPAAADLILGDARNLPLADASVDVVFAAGLLTHLPDPESGLRELARITRPGGRLVLFHPSGRAALAARHGRPLRPDEPLAETPLRHSTARTGWHLTSYDDPPHRFLAIATRRDDRRSPEFRRDSTVGDRATSREAGP